MRQTQSENTTEQSKHTKKHSNIGKTDTEWRNHESTGIICRESRELMITTEHETPAGENELNEFTTYDTQEQPLPAYNWARRSGLNEITNYDTQEQPVPAYN